MMLLALTACSTGSSNSADSGMLDDAFYAATGSLEDLNLRRREIPELLQKVSINPYAPPEKLACNEIIKELAALDTVLGPDIKPKAVEVASNDGHFMSDLENMELPTTEEALETGGNLAHDAVVGIIRSETSFLPFRSIIRRITGAERHSRNYEEAYQAGKIRRAYLKGLAHSNFGSRCLKKMAPKPVPKANAA